MRWHSRAGCGIISVRPKRLKKRENLRLPFPARLCRCRTGMGIRMKHGGFRAEKPRVKAAKERVKELNSVIRAAGDAYRHPVTGEAAVIHVDLGGSGFIDPLSRCSQPRMNDGIFGFIEEAAGAFPPLVPLTAVMHGAPPEDHEAIRSMVRRHYEAVLRDQLKEKRVNKNKMNILLVIGIVLIGLSLLLAPDRGDSVFLQVISIAGTFSLWEATNCLLIIRSRINRAMRETAQYLTMDIRFDPGSADADTAAGKDDRA